MFLRGTTSILTDLIIVLYGLSYNKVPSKPLVSGYLDYFKYFSSIKMFLIKNTYVKSVFPQSKFLDSYNYRSQISRPKVYNIFRHPIQIWQKIWKTKQKEPSSYWTLLTYEALNGPVHRTSLPWVGSEEVSGRCFWGLRWNLATTGGHRPAGQVWAGPGRPLWTLHQERTLPRRALQLLGQLPGRCLTYKIWTRPLDSNPNPPNTKQNEPPIYICPRLPRHSGNSIALIAWAPNSTHLILFIPSHHTSHQSLHQSCPAPLAK